MRKVGLDGFKGPRGPLVFQKVQEEGQQICSSHPRIHYGYQCPVTLGARQKVRECPSLW